MNDVDSVPAPLISRADSFATSCGVTEDEILLITGSPTLPFATGGGDLDLVLITPDPDRYATLAERRDGERSSEQVANGYAIIYADVEGIEVDAEIWLLDRVFKARDALGTGIHDVAAVEANFSRVGGLDVKVGTDLFHALRWGYLIGRRDSLAALRGSVPWPTYQAFKRDCALVNVRDATKGIPTSMRAGRLDEAYLKLCWAADSLVDAMIFHTGLSITRWKWRLRYLPLLEPWIGDWYRAVRFQPAEAQAVMDRHVKTLAETWKSYVGSLPADLAGS
jgi:hypothetical protein